MATTHDILNDQPVITSGEEFMDVRCQEAVDDTLLDRIAEVRGCDVTQVPVVESPRDHSLYAGLNDRPTWVRISGPLVAAAQRV